MEIGIIFSAILMVGKRLKLSGIDGTRYLLYIENIQLILGDWLLSPKPDIRNPQCCHQGEAVNKVFQMGHEKPI